MTEALTAFVDAVRALGPWFWPFVSVCLAAGFAWIIKAMGDRQIQAMSAHASSAQTIATELIRISDRLDKHDEKEEERHRETLRGIALHNTHLRDRLP